MNKLYFLILSTLLCFSSATAQINLTQGLIACYPFSGNANDLSGNNHNGTVLGPVLVADRFGSPASAYDFDGVNDYINIGQLSTFTQNNQMTIGAWIKPNLVTIQTILMLQPDDFYDRLNAMAYYSHNGVTTDIWDFGNCTAGGRLFDQNVVFSSLWNHFVFTVDQNEGMKIYKNGVLDYSITTSSQVVDRNRNLWIGGSIDWTNAPFFFDGIIDDMVIYDRALSSGEVQALYGSTQLCTFTSLSESAVSNNAIKAFFDNDFLNITLNTQCKNGELRLNSIDGKTILQKNNLPCSELIQLPVSELPAGVYVYTFTTETAVYTGKIVRINN